MSGVPIKTKLLKCSESRPELYGTRVETQSPRGVQAEAEEAFLSKDLPEKVFGSVKAGLVLRIMHPTEVWRGREGRSRVYVNH